MTGVHDIFMTEEMVTTALKEVIDPELGVNIVDLGLIYDLEIEDGHIGVVMTLTTPGCPLHASFKNEIESTLWRTFPGLQGVSVELVWTPPWTPERISPEGRAELGLV
ncbi:MAG: metal-sulfur cluster assembly factor [Candidatus Promineifilaceae bacterium]|nr:metal-sulfur cluster assembly factor [Candidatus Promineifilaceae bacterium]